MAEIFRETDFLRHSSFRSNPATYNTIVDCKLTWKLCDAGLFLLKADLLDSSNISQALEDALASCVKMLWPNDKPKPQTTLNAPGLYVPASLPTVVSRLQNPTAQSVHNDLIRFLRDMNLTFTCYSQPSLRAQGEAFLRFARSVEDALERMPGSETLDAQLDLLQI